MIKIILFIAVGYFGFRFLKSWVARNIVLSGRIPVPPASETDNVMIQDPVCRVYFHKKNGIHLHMDGKDLFFCSTECKERYLSEYKTSHAL